MTIFELEFNYIDMLKDQNKIRNDKLMICLWCGQPAQIIWVHGHGQCSSCGTNIDECCRGEQCDKTSASNYLSNEENNQ